MNFRSMVSSFAIAAAVGIGVGGGGEALGQVTQTLRPSSVALEIGTWRFTPVLREVVAEPTSVHSFLALRMDADPDSTTIQAVWYVRDNDPCSWSAQTWEAATVQEAVHSIKMTLNIDSSEDANWGLALMDGETAATSIMPAVPYEDGFLVTDPMGPWVNSLPNRDEMVEMLDSFGYPVADMLIERLGPDGLSHPDDHLNRMAAIIEYVELCKTGPNPAPNHVVPTIPTPVPANWPGFPPETVVPAAPSTFCYYVFSSGCFTVEFPWGNWTEGSWTFDRSIVMTQRCRWTQQVCRSRQVVEFCVQPAGTIIVNRSGYQQQCFTHTTETNWLPTGGCPTEVPDFVDPIFDPSPPLPGSEPRPLPVVWP